MTDQAVDRAFDWSDEISNDSSYTDLPDGEYPFVVTGLERERHAGSEKLPPCNKAVVYLEVDGGAAGKATIKHNLFLHSKTEGLLCEFFTGIGQRQHGEKMKMDWGRVIGSTGRLKLGHRTFNGTDGPVTVMDVKKFYEPAQGSVPAQAGIGYTAGAF
jgi:hypothetical protein